MRNIQPCVNESSTYDYCELLKQYSQELVNRAIQKGATIAFAESLTAGMTSSAVAAIPGASQVLLGGVAAYSNAIKESVLGVRHKTLLRYTAVSSQTALEMAQGAKDLFSPTIAASLTGYAGPTTDDQDTPVGTVFIAICSDTTNKVEHFKFEGTRNDVRVQAACKAIKLMTEQLAFL